MAPGASFAPEIFLCPDAPEAAAGVLHEVGWLSARTGCSPPCPTREEVRPAEALAFREPLAGWRLGSLLACMAGCDEALHPAMLSALNRFRAVKGSLRRASPALDRPDSARSHFHDRLAFQEITE